MWEKEEKRRNEREKLTDNEIRYIKKKDRQRERHKERREKAKK